MGIKVVSRIFGGLGNQLFCYAAARRLALVNNMELVIDDVSGFLYDYTYRRHSQLDHFNISCPRAIFLERLEPFSRVRRYLKRLINRSRSFDRRTYIKQEGFDFDKRLLCVKPRKTLYLEGYWQSEDYFKDIEATIRSDLVIKPPRDSINNKIANRIRNHLAVAIHVRFFDEPKHGGLNNTLKEYYARAVAKMEALVPDAFYYIFSDKPEFARLCIPLPDARMKCIDHNKGDASAYADMWLMTQCQHFIIANSTFSWWGAWLAEHKDKIVIAPGFELREGVAWWGFEGLIPDNWIKC